MYVSMCIYIYIYICIHLATKVAIRRKRSRRKWTSTTSRPGARVRRHGRDATRRQFSEFAPRRPPLVHGLRAYTKDSS